MGVGVWGEVTNPLRPALYVEMEERGGLGAPTRSLTASLALAISRSLFHTNLAPLREIERLNSLA